MQLDESLKERQDDPSHANDENREKQEGEQAKSNQNDGYPQAFPKELRYAPSHPKDLILGDPSHSITTKSSFRNIYKHKAFISQIEPKSFLYAKINES